MVFLKRWKKPKTKIRNLIKLGLDENGAKCVGYSRKGFWRVAQIPLISIAMPNTKLEKNGFLFFLPLYEEKVKQKMEKVVNI